MADTTAIAWTDSTFNPWWGCTKVAPGCDNCYAEALDKRVKGGRHWGVGTTPATLSNSYWHKPRIWNNSAESAGVRHKVFCGSMCDWTANNAPHRERERLWNLIRITPALDWQMLTKRDTNIVKCLPDDWGDGYSNVWLGVTVEDRKHGLRRMETLKTIPARVRFLSVEPLLEDLGDVDFTGIDWVIVGGESGPHARPMEYGWVVDILAQCREQSVPFFFKQWGGRRNKGGCLLNGIEC